MHPRVKGPTIAPWSRVRTELVAEYRVFGVERHAIVDGAGQPRMDVNTFRMNDWCNVIAITPEEKLVLVWQYRFGTGETPLEAAARELREESGYEAASFELLTSVLPNPAMQGNVCHAFVARGAVPSGAQQFDELEELEVVLVDLADLPALLDDGVIGHALVVSALETFLRRRRP
jgi:8-oxo-dGTP pyrophosphatase MutT (NUDIX family)